MSCRCCDKKRTQVIWEITCNNFSMQVASLNSVQQIMHVWTIPSYLINQVCYFVRVTVRVIIVKCWCDLSSIIIETDRRKIELYRLQLLQLVSQDLHIPVGKFSSPVIGQCISLSLIISPVIRHLRDQNIGPAQKLSSL